MIAVMPTGFTRMRFAIAALAMIIFSQPVCAADDARVASAAKAAGCPRDPALAWGADLGHLPGATDAASQIVATLSGDTDAHSLGQLCVALVRDDHGRFTRLASLAGPAIEPPNQIEQVTTVYVNVDKTPFRFKADETAFAVTVDGEYNSEVTNWNWSTLYLFRRVGARLMPIFHAKVHDETIDKTTDGKATGGRWIVRFDTARHRGAYDLILQRSHRQSGRRFIWDGARYQAVPATR